MKRLTLALAALAVAPPAFAQNNTVYKCLDASGRAQYTNVREDAKGKNCTIVSREVSVIPAQKMATPASFPKVDKDTQKARDDGRRKILEDELATEQRSLADAKTKLAEEEAVRNGDEQNYQKVLDRLKPYQDSIERHERNISAIQREIATIK